MKGIADMQYARSGSTNYILFFCFYWIISQLKLIVKNSNHKLSTCNENNLLSNSFLFYVFSGAFSQGKVELELSKTELRQGDDLTITCMITDKGKYDIGRIYRRIDGVPGGPVESEISSNNDIASALEDRYVNEKYDPEVNPTEIKVKINGK